jgi:hypothetical protein
MLKSVQTAVHKAHLPNNEAESSRKHDAILWCSKKACDEVDKVNTAEIESVASKRSKPTDYASLCSIRRYLSPRLLIADQNFLLLQ